MLYKIDIFRFFDSRNLFLNFRAFLSFFSRTFREFSQLFWKEKYHVLIEIKDSIHVYKFF